MQEPIPPPPQPLPSHSDKTSDDSPAGHNKSAPQCSVVSIYQTKIHGVMRHVTISWNKTIMSHSFSISVDGKVDGPLLCRVELKPWPFWGRKGSKTTDINGDRVDIFWDIRSAKFSHSPEPVSGYYVALVSQDEVVLLVGDSRKDAYKKTKSRPTLEDPLLLCKRENMFGKRNFTTRAHFDDRRRKDHDIVIENSVPGSRDPEMRISIDGIVLINVKNLHWKFRGNETIVVDQLPIQVLWDVHDWVFGGSWSQAFFIFKSAKEEVFDENGVEQKCQRQEEDQSGKWDSMKGNYWMRQ
ncbi:hypothetical protein LUZ60_017079 [Juncus effusus]|nr:hypothetical protein LUZ60_017079 [Juncus effusus]